MAETTDEKPRRRQTFGELCDLLGVAFDDLEDGDVITDVVAIVIYQSEEGEGWELTASEGMNLLKLKGIKDDMPMLVDTYIDTYIDRGTDGGEQPV